MDRSNNALRAQAGDGVVRFMIIVNLGAVFGVLALWPGYGAAIGDPVSIVAGGGISAEPSMIEYPYALLWGIPLAAICGAFVCRSLQMTNTSRLFAFFPLTLACACTAWLYFSYGYWNPHV